MFAMRRGHDAGAVFVVGRVLGHRNVIRISIDVQAMRQIKLQAVELPSETISIYPQQPYSNTKGDIDQL